MEATPHTLFSDDIADLKAQVEATPRKAVLLHHLHKTGGVSLKLALDGHFPGTSYSVNSALEVDRMRQRVRDGLLTEEKTFFIHGHHVKSVAALIAKHIPVFGLTVIRRPIEMLESRYSYAQSRHARHDLTPDSFLEQQGRNPALRNLGFRNFDDAVQRLSQKLSFVAIREEMDASVSMLSWIFSMPEREHRSMNVARASDYTQIPFAYAPRILEQCREDVKFYQLMAHRHTVMYRQFSALGGKAAPLFFRDEQSMPRKPQLNFELASNGDRVSLFLTGAHLFDRSDIDEALRFFDKAFQMDWAAGKRIYLHMHRVRPELADTWMNNKLAVLKQHGGMQAQMVFGRLKKVVDRRRAEIRAEIKQASNAS